MRIYHDPKGNFEHEFEFCELFIEPSGFVCPFEKGNFDFAATLLIEKYDSNEPKNIVTPIYTRVT
ncbi:12903_t:CDS:1, partial [Funneliformis caledonium]